MIRVISFLVMFVSCHYLLNAQEDMPALLTMPVHINPDDIFVGNFDPNDLFDIKVILKSPNGLTIFEEDHIDLSLDPNSLIIVPVGLGNSVKGSYDVLKEDLQNFDNVVFKIEIRGEESLFLDEFVATPYLSAYRSQYSVKAGLAESLEYEGRLEASGLENPNADVTLTIGGKNYTYSAKYIADLAKAWGSWEGIDTNSAGELTFGNYFENLPNNGFIVPALPLEESEELQTPNYFNLDNFIRKNQSFDADGFEIDVTQFTYGENSSLPFVYGCAVPNEINSNNTLYFNNTYGKATALDIILDEEEVSDSSFSAISVTSTAPYGLASLGNAYGLFGAGTQGGVLATPVEGADVSAGLYATIGYQLDENLVSYMVYADDQGQDNVYAGYFNGCVVFSKPPTTLSDSRLKTNVREINSILDEIKNLQPVSYQYLDSADKIQNGFLAEDVEKIFPELVSDVHVPVEHTNGKIPRIEKVEKFKSLDYEGLIPILTRGIQELTTELEDKSRKIEQQDQLIKDLIDRVKALENKIK